MTLKSPEGLRRWVSELKTHLAHYHHRKGMLVSANLRLVTVTVGYRPLTGVGQGPANKQIDVTMLVAKR